PGSRAARTVRRLRGALKQHGLTMRHFPQSFEMATLGGMIATRSGGHFATLYTHIDDFVQSTRTLTPAGIVESRRLPGSGAGPSPDRMMIGSEGALGIITEAWMRLQDRPAFRASTAVLFERLEDAAESIRVLSQAGLYPSNIRLLDAAEADLGGFGDGKSTTVVLAFENADHPIDAWMARALEVCKDHGGRPEQDDEGGSGHTSGTAGAWRTAFIRMPHFRRPLVSAGVIHDTFETAITWDRFAEFHAAVTGATRRAVEEVTGGTAYVSTRFTHIYPDGPAPYYTFVGLGRQDELKEQWLEIKRRASDALNAAGGTITHHHAVGRDHMPWYEKQRPDLFGQALGAVKKELDPGGILNPGVIVSA
ncbi:MAG: FAD-binding oxidoreductase, partial [Pseudomonadota bacterium]